MDVLEACVGDLHRRFAEWQRTGVYVSDSKRRTPWDDPQYTEEEKECGEGCSKRFRRAITEWIKSERRLIPEVCVRKVIRQAATDGKKPFFWLRGNILQCQRLKRHAPLTNLLLLAAKEVQSRWGSAEAYGVWVVKYSTYYEFIFVGSEAQGVLGGVLHRLEHDNKFRARLNLPANKRQRLAA